MLECFAGYFYVDKHTKVNPSHSKRPLAFCLWRSSKYRVAILIEVGLLAEPLSIKPDHSPDGCNHQRKDWPLWLDEAEGDPASLLHAAPEDVLRLWPVVKAVGNVKNDGPQLIEPTTVSEATLL